MTSDIQSPFPLFSGSVIVKGLLLGSCVLPPVLFWKMLCLVFGVSSQEFFPLVRLLPHPNVSQLCLVVFPFLVYLSCFFLPPRLGPIVLFPGVPASLCIYFLVIQCLCLILCIADFDFCLCDGEYPGDKPCIHNPLEPWLICISTSRLSDEMQIVCCLFQLWLLVLELHAGRHQSDISISGTPHILFLVKVKTSWLAKFNGCSCKQHHADTNRKLLLKSPQVQVPVLCLVYLHVFTWFALCSRVVL